MVIIDLANMQQQLFEIMKKFESHPERVQILNHS